MKRVSYKQVFLELSDDFGPEILSDETWLYRHLRRIEIYGIGGKYAFQRKAKLETVSDYVIPIPDDCVQILMVYLGDYKDNCIQFYNQPGTNFLQYSPSENNEDPDLHGYVWSNLYYNENATKIDFEIEGTNIKFYEAYDNEDVTLQYWKFETNEKNEILINESHVDAIKYGLIVKWLERDIFKRYKSSKLLRNGDISYMKDYRMKYAASVRQARADDNKENEKLQRQQIKEYFTFPVRHNNYD